MTGGLDRWAVVAALTLSVALAWDTRPTPAEAGGLELGSSRQGTAGRGYWSSSGDWRSPSGRGPGSEWRHDWRHREDWRHRDYRWFPPHHHYYGVWVTPPWPPAPPVWVPGRWVWNGWGWVWEPGYWIPY